MIISQIVGIIEDCDQNCDRVSKNDKIFLIFLIFLQSNMLLKVQKTLDVYNYIHHPI